MRIGPIVLACVLLAPAAARADTTVGDYTVQLLVRNDDDSDWIDLAGDELDRFFNYADCECRTRLALEVKRDTAPPDGEGETRLEIWSGSGCETTDQQDLDANCERASDLDTAPTLADVFNARQIIELDIQSVMFPGTSGAAPCGQVENDPSLWLMADLEGATGFEGATAITPALSVDTTPPPKLDSWALEGVEDAVNVTWEVPTTTTSIYGYQALCRRARDGAPLFEADASDAEYESPEQICGAGDVTVHFPPATPADAGVGPDAASPDAAPPDATPADAGIDAGPEPPDASTIPDDDFFNLDPRFLCSGHKASTETNIRIELADADRQPDDAVEVILVVYDLKRNPVAYYAGQKTPGPVTDFWETYEDAGGEAEGGHCFIATAAYGDYDDPSVRILRRFRDESLAQTELGRRFIAWYYEHSPPAAELIRRDPALRAEVRSALAPVVFLVWLHTVQVPAPIVALLAIAMTFLALRGTLRRRRRLTTVLAGLSLVLLAVSSAAAQPIPVDEDPYWSGSEDVDGLIQEPSHWAFELKFGPYTPDVASEGLTFDPWEVMYGGPGFLTQLELDRYFLWPRGMLGLGVTAGYMQKTANSFEADATPGDPDGPRSADENTFHLVPTSLSAIYRFTMLADETPIPLVPYAKLGLSYYFWWATKGNGDTSNTMTNGDASGGTLGWQGTLGISFRVDGIDPDGTADMRAEAGVEHVGLFFEVTYADVSGLGMDKKLHVGAAFWSAGLNFEW